MSETIETRISDAREELARLERLQAEGDCQVIGHNWQSVGGKNAGCGLGDDCQCSVPVLECTRCKDCDYGENRWRVETLASCTAYDDFVADELADAAALEGKT